MSVFEGLMLLSLVPLPLVLGLALRLSGRPWWWAAVVPVVVFTSAAIAAPVEAGQPRLRAGDLVFLLFCSALITGVAALGGWIGQRLRARRAVASSR